jgi:hypothetical protein
MNKLSLALVFALFSSLVHAQTSGNPGLPAQTPIGGGVSSVAVPNLNGTSCTNYSTEVPQITLNSGLVVVSGTLTGPSAVCLPQQWSGRIAVNNATTGAYSLTVEYQGAATGVIVPRGMTYVISGDGTTLRGPVGQPTTVATLGACDAGSSGATWIVNDAASPAWNGNLTGGGSITLSAFCNGINWTAH